MKRLKEMNDALEPLSHEPGTLRQELLSRTSEILAGMWILVILSMWMMVVIYNHNRTHERCIEALRSVAVADAVRMSLCKE